MNRHDIENLVEYTLKSIGLHHKALHKLVVGTALLRVEGGLELEVLGNLGLYGMSVNKLRRVYDDIKDKPAIAATVAFVSGVQSPNEAQLKYNLIYATCMMALLYVSTGAKLPESTDVEGIAEYWKEHYSPLGDTDVFIHLLTEDSKTS